jgi:hypothetical protein
MFRRSYRTIPLQSIIAGLMIFGASAAQAEQYSLTNKDRGAVLKSLYRDRPELKELRLTTLKAVREGKDTVYSCGTFSATSGRGYVALTNIPFLGFISHYPDGSVIFNLLSVGVNSTKASAIKSLCWDHGITL